MRLEYFQMIDRIVDVDVDARRAAFRLHRAARRARSSKVIFPAIR